MGLVEDGERINIVKHGKKMAEHHSHEVEGIVHRKHMHGGHEHEEDEY